MMFVNELVEIFMDYRDSSKDIWNRWGSNGDGLSQFCGILRFQQGHYLAYNPFGTNWLTSSYRHPNWVDHVESTGGINTGFGCALMFLFYVKDQLTQVVIDLYSVFHCNAVGAEYIEGEGTSSAGGGET
jgi:hypothetical protein